MPIRALIFQNHKNTGKEGNKVSRFRLTCGWIWAAKGYAAASSEQFPWMCLFLEDKSKRISNRIQSTALASRLQKTHHQKPGYAQFPQVHHGQVESCKGHAFPLTSEDSIPVHLELVKRIWKTKNRSQIHQRLGDAGDGDRQICW